MGNDFLHTLFVYGKEEDLKKFKEDSKKFQEDLEIGGKSVFCFEKLNRQQVDEIEWNSDGFNYRWLYQQGEKEDSNIIFLDATLIEKKDHLEYHFSPMADLIDPLITSLSEAYNELKFKYFYEYMCCLQIQEIHISGGIETKNYYTSVDSVYWKDDLYIDYEYGIDYLKNGKRYLHNATIDHLPDSDNDDDSDEFENDDLFTVLGKLGEVYIKSDCRGM
jgi:hypothetical protein